MLEDVTHERITTSGSVAAIQLAAIYAALIFSTIALFAALFAYFEAVEVDSKLAKAVRSIHELGERADDMHSLAKAGLVVSRSATEEGAKIVNPRPN